MAQARVQVGERLIQQQHVRRRTDDWRGAERRALLLAARELADAPFAEVGELDLRQGLLDTLATLGSRDLLHLQREGDVANGLPR